MMHPWSASRLAPCLALLVVPLLLAEQQSSSPAQDNPAAVIGSAHDLTPPTGRARLARGVCDFCHAAHLPGTNVEGEEPSILWSRSLPVNTDQIDVSPAPESSAQTVQLGSSKLCLSCHDGSIAVGQTLKHTPGGDPRLAKKLSPLTLSSSHPVGIKPVDDGQLVLTLFDDPPKAGRPSVTLRDGRIECLSCHTAHDPDLDSVVKKFLVESNKGGALCLACHDAERPEPGKLTGWRLSSHAQALHEVPNMELFGFYGNVADNACSNCHQPHEAYQGGLLREEEEKACRFCHGGSNLSPILVDVMSEFDKPYSHPTTALANLHDPNESLPLTENRHAECVDCHNPHSAGVVDENGSPPNRPAALSGASGFDGYRALYPATNEYEVCFKCHADSPNKPQNEIDYLTYGHTSRRRAEARAPDPKNLRAKFASSFSRHNVSQPRRLNHLEVPSLRESIVYADNNRGRELVVGTYIYCSDCHLSNDAARLGGTGADGPHGSAYPHILGARYQQENPPVVPGEESGGGVQYVPGTGGSYALCNLCHDIENSILADESFSEHRRHIVEERTSCATCHDPHGVQETLGTPENNRSLISFDLTIVAPDSLGRLYFDGLSRECYLSCHGVEHSPAQY